jgi:hypothetical protein
MVMRRTSLHLDDKDLRALEKIAARETTETGTRVSASGIVRRLVKVYLRAQKRRKQPG